LRGAAFLAECAFRRVGITVTLLFLSRGAFDAQIRPRGRTRIHERFSSMSCRFPRRAARDGSDSGSGGFGSRYIAGRRDRWLLPLAIPFHTVVNQTSAVDTFGLQPLAHRAAADSWRFRTPRAAVCGAAVLGLLFLNVRRQVRATVILVLIPLGDLGPGLSRISSGSLFARSLLPAKPTGRRGQAERRGRIAHRCDGSHLCTRNRLQQLVDRSGCTTSAARRSVRSSVSARPRLPRVRSSSRAGGRN